MKSKYIILALTTFTLLFGCQCREPTTLPGEILGMWKTSAPKYEGCFFEITKDSIIFANRDLLEAFDVNVISKIEKTQKEKQILYTIYYKKGKGEEYKFPFYYDPSEGGAIRFKNQKGIEWMKADVPSIEKLLIDYD